MHILGRASNYQLFLLQTPTAITLADAPNFRFAVGSHDLGPAGLMCLKQAATASGALEVHVLGGASSYKSFLLQTPTPIPLPEVGNFRYAVGDYGGGGEDLYCLKTLGTESKRLEVHIVALWP